MSKPIATNAPPASLATTPAEAARAAEELRTRGRLRKGTSNDVRTSPSPSPPRSSDAAGVRKDTWALAGPTRGYGSFGSTQEYIAYLLQDDAHDVERICAIPTSDENDGVEGGEGEGEDGRLVEPDVWVYEHMLRLAMDLNHLVIALQHHCTRTTCPEMRANEWLYICAAHSTTEDNDCCAIDYTVHSLDAATTLLNSNRYFPSRINIPQTSLRLFTSIARRLYRIFAHAYFHHRETFDRSEGETALFARFLVLIRTFDLIDADSLIIPPLDP